GRLPNVDTQDVGRSHGQEALSRVDRDRARERVASGDEDVVLDLAARPPADVDAEHAHGGQRLAPVAEPLDADSERDDRGRRERYAPRDPYDRANEAFGEVGHSA